MTKLLYLQFKEVYIRFCKAIEVMRQKSNINQEEFDEMQRSLDESIKLVEEKYEKTRNTTSI